MDDAILVRCRLSRSDVLRLLPSAASVEYRKPKPAPPRYVNLYRQYEVSDTLAEHEGLIAAMAISGRSAAFIAQVMGVSKEAICQRLRRSGMAGPRGAQKRTAPVFRQDVLPGFTPEAISSVCVMRSRFRRKQAVAAGVQLSMWA